MKVLLPGLFIALPVAFLLSCSPPRHASQSSAQANAFTYTAKLTNGQVFLSLNAKPDQMIGPFVKDSDGNYTCKTRDEGVHSLMRAPDGRWFYSWSYIHMRDEPVDARVLER